MADLRSIVEEHRFTTELAAIDADVRRTDEALHYVKELLAESPFAGLSTSTPGVMIAPIILPAVDGVWREASIFYVVGVHSVHLLSIAVDAERC